MIIFFFFFFSLLCCKGLVWCPFPSCATPGNAACACVPDGYVRYFQGCVGYIFFSLISCTQGLSAFGLRNLKEGKIIKVSVMKLLFNLLRLIHIVLPSSRQPN